MNERVKVLLYTVVASALLWLGVERFLGTTDEYASRLDIRSTPQDPNWDPENEIINARAPTNASSAVRARTEINASVEGAPGGASGEAAGGADEDAPEHDEDEERLTAADVERADSDGDLVDDTVVVPGTSAEEAALLERIDPELLSGRPSTRALDLTLVDCAVPPTEEPAADGDDAEAALEPRFLPDLSVAVRYRHGSIAIKGASLERVDFLVDAFRRCDSAVLVAERNPEGRADVDGDERLLQRRDEELEYYLTQRRVPRDAMRFPERS